MTQALEAVSGHSFRPDLLTPGGWVLDVGCRDFIFARAMRDKGMKVLALDPDKDIVDPSDPSIAFERAGLVGAGRSGEGGDMRYATWSTGEGNYICGDDALPPDAIVYPVPLEDIAQLMARRGIDFFDLVKLDCEGAEYHILLGWPGPIAKQVSIEFHDFAGRYPYDPEKCHADIKAHMQQWYDVAQYDSTVAPGNNFSNYWDSLFVLKGV